MGKVLGRGRNYQLAERAPDNAGEGKVGVWLKAGRSGRRREAGRRWGGTLFVGVGLCGVGARVGTPPSSQPRREGRKERGRGWGPAASLSRPVQPARAGGAEPGPKLGRSIVGTDGGVWGSVDNSCKKHQGG